MRIFLAISLLLGCFHNLISQNFNIAEHRQIDNAGGLISIHSKSYYFKEVLHCCGRYVSVIGIDENGSTLFTVNLNYNDGYIYKMIQTQDDNLLVYGTNFKACDVWGMRNFVAKIDTNGTIVFNKYIQSNWESSRYINDIAAASDTSFYLAFDDVIDKYSKNGLLTYSFFPGLENIKSIFGLPNGNLIVHGQINGVFVNIEYNPINQNIISQQNTVYSISKFEKEANGNFVALTNSGEIVSYDSTLVFLNSASSLTNSNVKVTDFIVRQDSVFVTGSDTVSNSPYYGLLNSNFTILNFSHPGYKGISPTGIALINKNKIGIITVGSGSTPITFTSLYMFPINGGFSSSKDIGVVSVKGLNSIIHRPSMYSYSPYADLEVTVKNFGTDTVKSFYLNNYYAGAFCPFSLHKLYQVTLAPGATVSVQTGTFLIRPLFMNIPSFTSSGDTVKITLCLFTTIPDYTNDIEITNDSYCNAVLFTVVGMQENDMLSNRIQLYPNPSMKDFMMHSEVEIENLEITDFLGSVMKREIIKSKEYILDAATFPSGVYFLKLETEKGSVTKKIIKQ